MDFEGIDLYLLAKTVHILSSTILFGTGLGIAFFMLRSYFSVKIEEKAYAAQNTVVADYIFTLPAVIIQPISGALLVHLGGFAWTDYWLLATYAIYVLVGCCWIPVIWLQIQLKQMAIHARETKTALPERYNKLFQIWFLLGWPAFIGLLIIFYLMVAKPI
ncbi:DUF2269 family protein [Sneathiella sp. P13V-1]|uniref:DUF2269 family protein n=1 Tax=Sneathiella sp. P13V-1 TaxID=2697366 RepID=UPI001D1210A1|nr:DUF2269 domain-containing protein [Sneathiella sp. P13V-1]MBE7636596.1 DUF2269 family protein [Sneathiella sp. P13V-1]